MAEYGRHLLGYFEAHPERLAIFLGVVGILVGLVLLRLVVLLLVKVVVAKAFEYIAVTRAGMGAGKPLGEIAPLTNYLHGFKNGMRLTLAGVLRGWTTPNAYDQLVVAEGLGMALRIRKLLFLGPSAAHAFRLTLPPTSSIGIGAYHSVISGLSPTPPKELITNNFHGWDALLRLESWYFTYGLTRFVQGRTEANLAMWKRMTDVAKANKEYGWAMMVGAGRCAHFVVHDVDERVEVIRSFGPELAPYARLGAGIPLLNTASDDVKRVGEILSKYPDPDRDDVGMGMALFLAFASHYWGEEWLDQFKGLTPELEKWFREIEEVSGRLTREHSPLADLASVKRLLDASFPLGHSKVEDLLIAGGLIQPA